MDIHDIDPPAFEPVDITYTKTFLRVDHDAEDALITDLITAARVRVETLIRGCLPTRRRLYQSHKTEGGGLFINHSPVTNVHRVSVVSCGGDVTDVPETSYTVNYRTTPVTLRLSERDAWRDYDPDIMAIEVELTAGYGPTGGDIPMPLRQAVLLLIAESYEHRSSVSDRAVPLMVEALLMPYRGLRL